MEHTLPHTTTTREQPVPFYEGNGSGVGINDLDNDGLLDIVLGNLNGANTILWNTGALQFRADSLGRAGGGRTRAVSLVDVDSDLWMDIVLTTQVGAPSLWHNNGDGTFTHSLLDGVLRPAYTLDWNDVDADGDLDLVTASYDAELTKLLRDRFLFDGGAGVYYYENRGGSFVHTRLADEAQALAIWLGDVDDDGSINLMVGNDFSFPDQHWAYADGAWTAIAPFTTTTQNTMSFDAADIDNDGSMEFFAADMRPPQSDDITQHSWEYVFRSIERASRLPDDIQLAENVLQVPLTDGGYRNLAPEMGVAATGWTWAAKFGDLDQDGYSDLYAVTGMQSIELFFHLPGDMLVEPNAAFRNADGAGFTLMPSWGLGSLASGRGMSMGDLDNDGDLDIVVNNLNAPSIIYENRLCGGQSLQVSLRDEGSANRYGIGARLTLHTSAGSYTREMRAGSGYLSGDPARVHFGFPSGAQLQQLEIRWSDHQHTIIDQFPSDPFIIINRP